MQTVTNEINSELKKVITAIADFWESYLHDEYFLFIGMDKSWGHPNNFLFGNMKDARITPPPQSYSYSDIPLSLLLSKIDDEILFPLKDNEIIIKKTGFISNDLIYTFNILEKEGLLSIILDIDNMTYGRGRMNSYIIAICKNGLWELSSQHYKDRTSRYDHISGSIKYCINYIFKNENELEHPYQSMINSYSWKYEETQSSVLEINLNNGSLGFNGQSWLSI
jgi:hypothetical protein